MNEPKSRKIVLNEDWWAVIAAGLLILLSALGVIGEGGLKITF
ncbi:MAG: hypothetical protein FD146_2076 [Anaerolineaceae bacterium]|nr:MAG: hypothetical protein FD146_2076 [Anaerolineaceae bacterium]